MHNMTNEELATQIIRGNKDLYPILWDKVKAFFFKEAFKSYIYHRDKYTSAGVELTDVQQSMYLAFVSTVQSYDPEKEYKLLTYSKFHIKNTTNDLLGRRTANIKPLNNCISLDTPLNDGTEDLSLIDTIEDDTNDFEAVDRDIFNNVLKEVLNNALAECKNVDAETIRLYFYDNIKPYEIVKRLNLTITPGTVHQRIRTTLSFLRSKSSYSDILRELYNEADSIIKAPKKPYNEYHGTGLASFRSSGTSSVEKIVERSCRNPYKT